MNKEFIFLFPIREIINLEIEGYGKYREGGAKAFKKKYGAILNQCIDQRYRQKQFGVNWVVFDDCTVADVIKVRSGDKIIRAGINYQEHIIQKTYPNWGYVLKQIGKPGILRIAGFHLWDCVDKMAQIAHETGLGVLVDEDLTELFIKRMNGKRFKTDSYPSYNPKEECNFNFFMQKRKNRPWFWQKY